MVKVTLDVLEDKGKKTSTIDFKGQMPVIETDTSFQFEVDNWAGDTVTELTFSEFRANSNDLNPGEMAPVKFGHEVRCKDAKTSWTIRKDKPDEDGKWRTGPIQLEADADKDRRLIEYTLTMKLDNGTCVAVDPPLDERRPKR